MTVHRSALAFIIALGGCGGGAALGPDSGERDRRACDDAVTVNGPASLDEGVRRLRLSAEWDLGVSGEVAFSQDDSCVFASRLAPDSAPGEGEVRRLVREIPWAEPETTIDTWFRVSYGCWNALHRTVLREVVSVPPESGECLEVRASVVLPRSTDLRRCSPPELAVRVHPCAQSDGELPGVSLNLEE